MKMKYYAKLSSKNKEIEEEATFSFGEYELCCFIDYSPIPIEVGETYLIEIGLWFIDDEGIEKSTHKEPLIRRFGNTFKHEVNGYLTENKLMVYNLVFQDDLFYDFSYLDGDFIILKPDRITVSIISK